MTKLTPSKKLSSDYSWALGQIWQILIFLTLALSCLNGIMWITALRPKALENEIIQTNRHKVIIFGVFEQSENKKMNWYNNQKPCQDNEAEIIKNLENQKSKWHNFDIQINNYKNKIYTLEEEIQKFSPSQNRTLLKKLAASNQDYLQALSLWKSQRLTQGELIANWQNLVNKFCVTGLKNQAKMIPELQESLTKLDQFKDLENWQQNNQEWLKCAKELVQNKWSQNAEKPEIKEKIDDWKAKTTKIFEIEIKQPNLGKDFVDHLRELENWEMEQLQDLGSLEKPKIENSLIFFRK